MIYDLRFVSFGCGNYTASLYNTETMVTPEQLITKLELHRNTGEHGTRKWIAYEGIIYDVTDCPKWRLEMHEQLHFPGQDLTTELPDAPHKNDVFTRPCVKIVGRLE